MVWVPKLIKMVENPPAISDLPIWRKMLIVPAFCLGLLTTATAVYKDVTIYEWAPDHPLPATGQTYLVSVMHGYVRYVTLEAMQSFSLWEGREASWAGPAFVGAFFLWVTSPKKTRTS
jgi:hypothetical protein